MELDASEIRWRAERRIGEMIVEQRHADGLNTGTRRQPGGSATDPPGVFTLAEVGIDKHLADRSREMAAIPAEEFHDRIATVAGRLPRPTLRHYRDNARKS